MHDRPLAATERAANRARHNGDGRAWLALLCCEVMQEIAATTPSVRTEAAHAWHQAWKDTPSDEFRRLRTELFRLLCEDNSAGLRRHRGALRGIAEHAAGLAPADEESLASLACALRTGAVLWADPMR